MLRFRSGAVVPRNLRGCSPTWAPLSWPVAAPHTLVPGHPSTTFEGATLLQHVRRSAITAATALAVVGSSLLAGGGAAHAASPGWGFYDYRATSGPCLTTLVFFRAKSDARQNTAQGVLDALANAPSYVDCVGALYRSSNGGRTWVQVSATHSIWGTPGTATDSWTNVYADGPGYLARACVHFVDGHSGRSSASACTTAH